MLFRSLWSDGQLPIKAILMVTHNIEEAVFMCDRILVFSSDPGRIAREIRVELPHPRDRDDPAFRQLVDSIYVEMTARKFAKATALRSDRIPGTGIAMQLPRVGSNLISGLIEAVSAYEGKADLPEIASELHMEIDDLFPVADALQLLRFAEIEEGDIRLTAAGKAFAEAETEDRKSLFARHLLTYVPLAAHIRRVLEIGRAHV